MFNFKQTKTDAMNKVAAKSTLLTFALTTIGVVATAYLASKEIPKAKAEVKAILEREDLTKTQKATESVKVVAKNTWKTAVVGIGTILLVTGTAAITTANTAATVAGLTSAVNLAEQKLKDTNEVINELPDKAKEEVKRNVTQKAINRATADLTEENYVSAAECPNMYIWVNDWDGVRLMATYQMIDSLEDIVDAKITQRGFVTVADVYDILVNLGAKIIWNKGQTNYYAVDNMYGWSGGFRVRHNVYMNSDGYTVYNLDLSTPDRDA